MPPAGSTAAKQNVVGRVAALLEENGTVVVVVAAFAATPSRTSARRSRPTAGWRCSQAASSRSTGCPRTTRSRSGRTAATGSISSGAAQFVLYELERLGGLQLVMLVHAALVTLGLAGAAVLARRLGGSARSTTWVALPVLVAYWPGAAVMRPQSFAYPLFVAVLWLLLDDLRLQSRRVYLVLPLLVLWANLHGSVIVGAALVLQGYALVELAGSLWKKPRTVRPRSLVLLVAPWLCMLASPYATSLPHYYRTIFSSSFGTYVTEWAPTTLTLVHAPIYLLALGGLWLIGRTRRTASLFEILAFVGLSVLAFDAVRNAVWLALISLVVLPRLMDTLRAPAVEPKRMNRMLAIAMLAGVALATVVVAFQPASWFTKEQYPVGAENAAAAAAGGFGRIFAEAAARRLARPRASATRGPDRL